MVEDPLSAGEPGPQTPGAFPRAPEPVLEPAAAKEPRADVVRTPRWVLVTLETPGLSRETLEEPASAGASRAAYRNGVLDLTIPRRAVRPKDAQGGTRDGR